MNQNKTTETGHTFSGLMYDVKATPKEREQLAQYLGFYRMQQAIKLAHPNESVAGGAGRCRHCGNVLPNVSFHETMCPKNFGSGADSNGGQAGGEAQGKSSPASAVINSPDQSNPSSAETPRYRLWAHLLDEHKLTLLDSELEEIVRLSHSVPFTAPAP